MPGRAMTSETIDISLIRIFIEAGSILNGSPTVSLLQRLVGFDFL